ncbi:MAG: GAF domain-containing protein [Anaerolineales bacterium]|nr:GAF domain-containing protein [Anaerolineales bacterium]
MVPSQKNIRVLFLEDNPSDSELSIASLEAYGFTCEWKRIETRKEFLSCLDEPNFDLIIADYNLPSFDGLSALKLVIERNLDIPFILVSGAVGEEIAIEILKAGATDYVMKDQLSRLAPVVERALLEKAEQRRLRQAEIALKKSEANLARAQQMARIGSWDLDMKTGELFWSAELYRLYAIDPESTGNSADSLLEMVKTRIHPDDLVEYQNFVDASMREKKPYDIEHRVLLPEGEQRYFQSRCKIIIDNEGTVTEIAGTVMDITERKLMEQALKNEKLLIDAMMDNIPDTIYFKDRKSRLTRINRQLMQNLGLDDTTQILGKTDIDLYGEEFGRKTMEDDQQIIATGKPLIGAVESRALGDGTTNWTSTTKIPLKNANNEIIGLVGITREINDLIQAEQRSRRLLKQQIAANRLAFSLGEAYELEKIYKIIYAHVSELMDVEAFLISFYDPDTQLIRAGFIINKGEEWDAAKLPPVSLSKPGQGTQSQVIQSGKPFYAPDYRKALKKSETKYTVENNGTIHSGPPPENEDVTNSALFVPMKDRGEVIGVMQVQSYQLDAYSRDDIDLLSALANVASISIQNARLLEAANKEIAERNLAETRLKHSTDELSRLYRASGALLASTSPRLDLLARAIVDTVQVEFKDALCSLILVQPNSEKLDYLAISGPSAGEVVPGELKLGGPGLIPRAIQSGEIINSPDVLSDPDYIQTWKSARSKMVIPLKIGEQTVGVIDVQSEKSDAFSTDDERLMSLFSDRATFALENARLFSAAEQRLKRLISLHNIYQSVTGSLDLQLTLNLLLDQILQQLSIDAAAILLYQPDQQLLEFVASKGFRTSALQFTKLRLGEGYAGVAALERRIVHIVDINEHDPNFQLSPLLYEEDFITYIGIPLTAKGKIVGVLEIFHRKMLDPNPEEINFLETLAGQAAIAIDNITLFEQLQQSNVELMHAYDATIEGWARALELRDMETEGHSRRVVDLTMQLAGSMGISKAEQVHIRRGALLHDIGKMGVPDSILQKPGKLTEKEWETMRNHPIYACEWIAPIQYLQPALDIPCYHHEKWDGSGYPSGLKGEEIPLAARIFAVVDVWDALCSDRPYRKAWTRERAIEHIAEQSGKHFDPQVVSAFMPLLEDLECLE